MRRNEFLHSALALAAVGAWPLTARANAALKMMIPANPGGGWDTTGRTLGKALQDAGLAASVTFDNKGGAAGALGLAQFLNGAKGDPNALMVMGAVMLGGLITSKSPLNLMTATPIARLTSEYNVFVLPESSPLKTMKDVVDQLKKDPASVKWGGGSRGSTEHIAAAMIAQEVGVDASKINYVAFRGGGEATAAILGGNVTVGGSGYSEFQQYIEAGKMRPIGVTSAARLKGINVPTLKEQGINVEIGNWRGVFGGPGITAEQRKTLTEMVSKATQHKSWAEALEKNGWTPALLSGDAFTQFVDREFATLRATMARAGMLVTPNPEAAMADPAETGTLHQTLVGAGTLLLGAAMAVGATTIPGEAGYAGIGPNFLPWLVSVALMICGALLLWEARSGGFRHLEPPSGAERGDWDALAWISAGVLLNAAAIERIGFIASCALCYAFAVRGLRRSEGRGSNDIRGVALDVLTGVLIAAPAFWIFTKLLKINLPGLTGTGWF